MAMTTLGSTKPGRLDQLRETVGSPATVDELTGWVEAGPGVADTPAGPRRHAYTPSRSARPIT